MVLLLNRLRRFSTFEQLIDNADWIAEGKQRIKDFKRRRNKMEVLGIMGFIFGLAALSKVLLIEKQLKDKGVL